MVLRHPAARVGIGVAVILLIPLIAMLFTDQVVWTFSDFVFVGVLLAIIGTAVELAVKKSGNRLAVAGIAILGLLAIPFGFADDAPGLVVLGLLLLASAFAVARRGRRRRMPPPSRSSF
jgi:hypothetical protein